MKIWLIKEGEPLPCDDHPRLMRTGLLAQYLISKGHEVTWWSSTYDHGNKRYRYTKHTELPLFDKGNLVLLHSRVHYRRNMSVNRIVYHHQLAKQFERHSRSFPKPDVILCAYPTCDFAMKAIAYRKQGVPVFVDIRDLWPDIFTRAIPGFLRGLSNVLLYRLNRNADTVMRSAAGIIAINQNHLDWGLRRAGRSAAALDCVHGLSYQRYVLTDEQRAQQRRYWAQLGVTPDTWNICFMGTLSATTLDMDTVIEAFNGLCEKHEQMRLVICGNGDGFSKYKKSAEHNARIVMPGWQNGSQIASLMEMGSVGLYPYHAISNFQNSLTNKVIEYMASGLPVLTSLTGYAKEYIEQNRIGLPYEDRNPESLAKAVTALLDDPARLKTYAANASQVFDRDFDSNHVNAELENLLLSAVKEARKA